MSRRPHRRKHGEEHGDDHPDERWMASYMDMVTVLMCMFIVLYAMSSVDQQKFEQLRASLATGFGAVETATVDTAEGTVVPAEFANADGESFTGGAAVADTALSAEEDQPGAADAEAPSPEPSAGGAAETAAPTPSPSPSAGGDAAEPTTDRERALAEVENLRALQARIDAGLRERDLQETVRYVIDERGLTIRLVSSETFFLPDSAQLTDQTLRVLESVGPILASIPNEVDVEGNTARLPESVPRPLDWELSTARAVNVVRNLIDTGGVPAPRLSAVGYGESRPLAAGTSESELELNRRVDIVVHSGEPESVRALIPEIAGGK
ncbi:flagellar motor protein MotB [Arthrobacter agilis]|uniref:OmpA/MotB family protein n=1 Tax=Arthrobacter agilis TaxID=37921 RepID=UPI002365CD1C|nr:flagellar motor protein MotB [Arthrobacter agilis]WDF33772.1 flagellar motor protein MotB [Arthrobacter agilis]